LVVVGRGGVREAITLFKKHQRVMRQ
jgi:hypothetical protein